MDPTYDEVLEIASRYAQDYLRNLDDQPVYPNDDALRALTAFDEEMPQGGYAAPATLKLLHQAGSPAIMCLSCQLGFSCFYCFSRGGCH